MPRRHERRPVTGMGGAGGGRRDEGRPVTITPYRDGPYLVRGSFALLDQGGEQIPLGRSTVALCRCGKSQIRPFCDGTHRLIGFRAEGTAEGAQRAAATEPGPAPVARGGDAFGSDAWVRRRRGAGSLLAPSSCPSDLEPAVELALASAERARETLRGSLDGPCAAEEHVAMRGVEPLVAAACALLRERAASYAIGVSRERGGEPARGWIAASAALQLALDAAKRVSSAASDVVLDAAYALLAQADEAMRR